MRAIAKLSLLLAVSTLLSASQAESDTTPSSSSGGGADGQTRGLRNRKKKANSELKLVLNDPSGGDGGGTAGEKTRAECSGCKDGVDGCDGVGYCNEGLECCNASCGTCVQTGDFCTMQVCDYPTQPPAERGPLTESYPTEPPAGQTTGIFGIGD